MKKIDDLINKLQACEYLFGIGEIDDNVWDAISESLEIFKIMRVYMTGYPDNLESAIEKDWLSKKIVKENQCPF